MGPVLAQRRPHIGGGKQPRRARQLRAGRAAVIAGPVEPFMVRPSEHGHRPQPGASAEHALGQVPVQPDPLSRVDPEWSRTLPHARGDAHGAEVGDQRGATQHGLVRGGQAAGPPGRPRPRRAGSSGPSSTSTAGPRSPRPRPGSVQGHGADPADRLGLGREDVLPHRPVVRVGQPDRAHGVHHRRVVGPAAASSEHLERRVGAGHPLPQHRVACHDDHPHGDRDRLRRQPVGQAAAVPPLVGVRQRADYPVAQAQPHRQPRPDLAVGDHRTRVAQRPRQQAGPARERLAAAHAAGQGPDRLAGGAHVHRRHGREERNVVAAGVVRHLGRISGAARNRSSAT